jgi:hypothetical protein
VDVYTTGSPTTSTIGLDANGHIYACGNYTTSAKNCTYTHWLVRRSSDNGLTWANVDDRVAPCGSSSLPNGFALDAFKNIVLVGSDSNANGQFWLTRNSFATGTSSTGDSGTWVDTDESQYAPPNFSVGYDICRDSSGNLYAVGVGGAANGQHWLVRKQAP